MATIVIMPGGFHPFHAGHYALYRSAVEAFPDADVYVAATADTSTRPFPFPVKEKLAKLAGVPANRFVQVRSPFKAEEITTRYNPLEDTLIFVRSEKDRTSPPKPGGTKRDGSPSYLQPYTGKDMEPFAKHAYMAYLPTVEFGLGMTSATQIRSAWPGLDERRKTALVMSLYPKTQSNTKLAATVVKLLDAAISGDSVEEDISRRGFLRGLGAAAVAGASNDSKAGIFRTSLFDSGTYSGRAVRLAPAYSDSIDGHAGPRERTDIKIKIDGTRISLFLDGTTTATYTNKGKPLKVPTSTALASFDHFIKTKDGIKAVNKKSEKQILHKGYKLPAGKTYGDPDAKSEPVDPKEYTITKIDILEIQENGSLIFRRITEQQPAEKGYRFNIWGLNGIINTKTDFFNENVDNFESQGVAEASYMSVDDYKNNLQNALPSIIEYYQDELGFTPSKEQLASAVKAAHATMEKTGDTEQAGESLEAVLDSFVPSNSSNKNLPKIDFKKNLLQVLQQKYPDAEFKITPDRVESTDGQLSVIADTAQEGRYVGCFMWDVSTGPYKGALGLAIKQTTDQLLQANPGKKPALFISGDNQNPKAWSYIAKKLKYKLITDENELEEGSLNEFAVDGFGDNGDHRSKLLASVGRLFDAGNKVDWQVPGQMGHVTRVQDDGITMKKWKKPHSRMSFFLPMTDDSRDKNYTIKMVGPKHYAVVSAEQDVEENQGWAATYEEVRGAPSGAGAGMTAGYQRRENQPIAEKQRPEIERDPELKQARLFAKQHYPEFSGDEELAYDKWVQRSIQHGLEDDQKQFKLLQGVAEKIKRLERTIAVVKQQRQQQTNEDYIDEKWSKKYKSSINCANPRGFSQRAHCAGRKK